MQDAPTVDTARAAIAAHASKVRRRSLRRLFAENPGRTESLLFNAGPLTLDLSRMHVDADLLAAGAQLLQTIGFARLRDALMLGGIANATEQRPALHPALRAAAPLAKTQAGLPVAAPVLAARAHMQRISERLRADRSIDSIVHVGIGGSFLGPQLVLDALSRPSQRRFDVRFLANIDGEAFERAVDGLDPARTVLLIASKSWTTQETRRNADKVEQWLASAGVEVAQRRIAITARPELARVDGYADDQILPFADWVGGRFSVWSGIGLPVALALGWETFAAFLDGAAQIDAHFADTVPSANLPVLAALASYVYCLSPRPLTRAVFGYDQRLGLLVPYLQQLEMESLGKRIGLDGHLRTVGAPVTWGGLGTDGQHAVFQWLHQGVDQAVTEFVLSRSTLGNASHHRSLIANALAQGSALMQGLGLAEVRASMIRQGADQAAVEQLAPHRTFPGNRPSTFLVADDLGPASLGALLAFYEHRTTVLGWLLGINPFDQWGVELGKVIAATVEQAMTTTAEPTGLDPATRAWIKRLKTQTQ
jgi:glucose-6-phosphate isomerase